MTAHDLWPAFEKYAKESCIPLDTLKHMDDARPFWEAFQAGAKAVQVAKDKLIADALANPKSRME